MPDEGTLGGLGPSPDNPGPEGAPISQGERGGPIDSVEAMPEGRPKRQIEPESALPDMGGPIEPGAAARPGVGEIRGEVAQPTQSGPIGATVDPGVEGRELGPPAFGIPGQSIEFRGAYQGGSPVGGPASIFNIGGAPIAILGGVFSGGLPIGGPVTQIFRSGSEIPNTLFIITLESSGPIGAFFIGNSGEPIGLASGPAPVGGEGREGPAPIGQERVPNTGLQLGGP